MGSVYQQIGRQVAALRRERGWTQERLAEEAGIGASYVARIETGQRRPTLGTLEQIAGALGLPMARLFDAGAGANGREAARANGAVADALRLLSPADLRLLVRIAGRLPRERRGAGHR